MGRCPIVTPIMLRSATSDSPIIASLGPSVVQSGRHRAKRATIESKKRRGKRGLHPCHQLAMQSLDVFLPRPEAH